MVNFMLYVLQHIKEKERNLRDIITTTKKRVIHDWILVQTNYLVTSEKV